MIALALILGFSTLTGIIIGSIYGWKAGLLSAVLWPIALLGSIYDSIKNHLTPL